MEKKYGKYRVINLKIKKKVLDALGDKKEKMIQVKDIQLKYGLKWCPLFSQDSEDGTSFFYPKEK